MSGSVTISAIISTTVTASPSPCAASQQTSVGIEVLEVVDEALEDAVPPEIQG